MDIYVEVLQFLLKVNLELTFIWWLWGSRDIVTISCIVFKLHFEVFRVLVTSDLCDSQKRCEGSL